MKDKKNLVVLDFDGVCTSMLPDGGSYLNNPPSKYHWSKDCIDNLQQLLTRASAEVVISTNWRRFKEGEGWTYRGQKYINPLPELLKILDGKVAGMLPKDKGLRKSEALILWIEGFKHVPNFVIFDDDLREGFQDTFDYGIYKKFILTNPQLGLTVQNINKAMEILEEQNHV